MEFGEEYYKIKISVMSENTLSLCLFRSLITRRKSWEIEIFPIYTKHLHITQELQYMPTRGQKHCNQEIFNNYQI
jgi:hypothetical protein